MRVVIGLDLTIYPKHYFWVIYTHSEEIMTKCLRRSFDKTYTMKFRQSVYDEVMTKHIRLGSMKS